jgi:hypothetical protein
VNRVPGQRRLLAAVLAVAAALPAQDNSRPASAPVVRPHEWDQFAAILWLHGGPPRDEAFFRRVRQAGFTAVSVDQDEDHELPARHGLRFYLEQAAGKGHLELRDPQYRPKAADYERTRSIDALSRPSVLGDPATLQELGKLVRQRVERARDLAPLAVSLGDEISVTRHCNPLDFCFDGGTLGPLRAELRARYGGLEALNQAWGTAFTAWEQVRPMTWDEMRARESGPGLPRNLAPWAALRFFMDARLAADVAGLAQVARAADPRARVGFAGGQLPSAYGGSDYARLLAACDFAEVYDQCAARELTASLLRSGARRFETIAPPRDEELLGALVEARVFDLLAHGLSGVCVWSAGEVFAADTLTVFGLRLATVLPLVTGSWTRRLVTAVPVWSPVWILESQRSVAAHWALDAATDGATWVRRLSSHEATHSTSAATRLGWARLCQDLGLQPRFVSESRLEDQSELRHAPRVLVLPATLALSDRAVEWLTAFCEQGGTLVADQTPGWYDDLLRLRERPPLDALFGVRSHGPHGVDSSVREGRVAQGTPRNSEGMAFHEPELVPESRIQAERNRPAYVQLTRPIGTGRAILLNLAVCEYPSWRLDLRANVQAEALRGRIGALFAQAGVTPWCRVEAPELKVPVEQLVFDGPHGRTLVLRPHALDSPARLRLLAGAGPVELRVILPARYAVRDLLTGRAWPSTQELQLTMDPLRGAFLALDPP